MLQAELALAGHARRRTVCVVSEKDGVRSELSSVVCSALR